MKLLMHTCCAPCSVYCIDSLRKEGIEPTVYWYNPNIHPYIEYKTRRDTLKEYTKSINVEAIFEEEYGLDNFCKNVDGDLQNRCQNYCYRIRLEQTAKFAKEKGYDTITTTLLVSPYQKHEILKAQAEEIATKYGLDFLYRDFRVGFREGQAKARELGLYMQKYCGCIFSEEERYAKQIKRDKEKNNMEHIHSIIIIKKGNKYLNYYDEKWGMYLFPNIKGNDIETIKKMYNIDNVKLLFDKIHNKYSVSHKEMRTYHHYFYEVDADIEGKYFSLDELLADSKVREYNGDIVKYIDEFYKVI